MKRAGRECGSCLVSATGSRRRSREASVEFKTGNLWTGQNRHFCRRLSDLTAKGSPQESAAAAAKLAWTRTLEFLR